MDGREIQMQRYVQSRSGLKVPKIFYGTAWKKERTADLVLQAIKAGFRGIDTACQPKHYEEALVGEALLKVDTVGLKREDLFVQTKFTPLAGQDPNNIPYDKNASLKTQVAQSFVRSKQNLQTDYVDSLVLHSPLFPFNHLMQVYQEMEVIFKDQGARQLGISNCYDLPTLQRLYNESEIKPALLQNRFYRDTDYDREIRSWCNDHGVLYQSFWSLTANPQIVGSKRVFDIARKYGISSEQVFFIYLCQSHIIPLSGTTSLEHMQEDIAVLEMTLDQEEMQQIDGLLL
jgi:diketogulonate reductase-like aldo/keto reductase